MIPSLSFSDTTTHAESTAFNQQGANVNYGINFSPMPQTPSQSAPDHDLNIGGITIPETDLVWILTGVILFVVLVK